MRWGSWLPPILWMALILALSTDAGSAAHTGRFLLPILRALFPSASPGQLDAMHAVIRKLGHFTEYAVLGALWLRALVRGHPLGAAAWRAWLIAAAWAIVDEGFQSTVASRTSSAFDVALDAAGALAAVAVLARAPRWRRASRSTR